jgi:hypothetical protein
MLCIFYLASARSEPSDNEPSWHGQEVTFKAPKPVSQRALPSLPCAFSCSDGLPLTYSWDFTSNGTVGATAANPTHTYVKEGVTVATLTLKTTKAVRTCTVPIDVASSLNNPPQVSVDYPFEGGIYTWGDMIDFSVSCRVLYQVPYTWPSAKACLNSLRGLCPIASACLIPACTICTFARLRPPS